MLNAFGANKAIALNRFEMGELNLPSENSPLPGVSVYYRPDNAEILVCLSAFNQRASKVQIQPVLMEVLKRVSLLLSTENFNYKQTPYFLFVFEDKHLINGKSVKIDDLDDCTLELSPDSYRNIWIKPAFDHPSVLYALSNGDKLEETYNPATNELIMTINSRARTEAETAILGPIPKNIYAQNKKISFAANNGWYAGEFPCNKTITIQY
jgi:hypothetical protein